VQVDPIKPNLKPTETKLLKRKCDILVTSSAFKFSLRRYNEVDPAKWSQKVEAAAAAAPPTPTMTPLTPPSLGGGGNRGGGSNRTMTPLAEPTGGGTLAAPIGEPRAAQSNPNPNSARNAVGPARNRSI